MLRCCRPVGLLLVLCVIVATHGAHGAPARPSSADCTWKYFDQTLDHFNLGVTVGHNARFKQRYCIVDRYWSQGGGDVDGKDVEEKGPIFFYTGNESPVEVYINNTGLMWELAPKYKALIVFAEHRYEGESVPDQINVPNCLSYCTSEQALADYAVLIDELKTSLNAQSSPVIAFGGSYGGMLASWLRFKYPSAVDGAIAASAPIYGFPLTSSPVGLDAGGVAISRGVSAEGGATDMCRDNIKFAWPLIRAIGSTSGGRDLLSATFKLCNPLQSEADVNALIAWGNAPWFNLAEGNFPFASTYITFAVGPGLYPLPPWPMRVACQGLNQDFKMHVTGDVANVNYTSTIGKLSVSVNWDEVTHDTFSDDDIRSSGVLDLLGGLREAVGVWYNVTHTQQCFNYRAPANNNNNNNNNEKMSSLLQNPAVKVHARDEKINKVSLSETNVCTATQKGSWGPICCNDNLNLINWVVTGIGRDIFWPPSVARNTTIDDIVNRPGSHTSCQAGYAAAGLYGVPSEADPWAKWMTTYYGGRNLRTHSNIVFSNGLMDPWSAAGVYGPHGSGPYTPAAQNVTADGSIVSVQIALGGHHLDLFFADDNDPDCVKTARQLEDTYIGMWIDQAREQTMEEKKWAEKDL